MSELFFVGAKPACIVLMKPGQRWECLLLVVMSVWSQRICINSIRRQVYEWHCGSGQNTVRAPVYYSILWEWCRVKVEKECANLLYTEKEKPGMGIESQRSSPVARSKSWRWEFEMEIPNSTGFQLCLHLVVWCMGLDPFTGSGVEWIPLLPGPLSCEVGSRLKFFQVCLVTGFQGFKPF